MVQAKVPMLGKQFGRLTVIEQVEAPQANSREAWYRCQCQCGNSVVVRGTSLRKGITQSCGCLHSELASRRNLEYAAKHYDLTGKRFHRLTVESLLPLRHHGQQVWRCRCECGNIHDVATHNLLTGTVKSCGCLPTNVPIDLSGRRFGQLTVLELTNERKSNGGAVWKCRCDCGTELSVSESNLKRGATVSCGCVRRADLTGMQFGKLTVLRLGKKSNQGNGSFWICRCSCGNECEVHAAKLKSGHTTSCGCAHSDLINDLVGQTFGKLTVLCDSGQRRKGSGGVLWQCRCECGQEKQIRQDALLSGSTVSCGCVNSRGNAKIAQILQEHSICFIPEYSPADMPGQYRFDFAVVSGEKVIYCIEYDGILHFEYTGRGWDTEERYQKTIQSDTAKNDYCTKNGIPLIRIPYTVYETLSVADLTLESSAYLYHTGADDTPAKSLTYAQQRKIF